MRRESFDGKSATQTRNNNGYKSDGDDDIDNDDNNNNNDDDKNNRTNFDELLRRDHDGETVDLGELMRAAHKEADTALARAAAAAAPVVTSRTRQPALALWMLPQQVASEVVALRLELDQAAQQRDAQQANIAALEARMNNERARATADLEQRANAIALAQRLASEHATQRDSVRAQLDATRLQCDELEAKLRSSALAAAEATSIECDKLRVVNAQLVAGLRDSMGNCVLVIQH